MSVKTEKRWKIANGKGTNKGSPVSHAVLKIDNPLYSSLFLVLNSSTFNIYGAVRLVTAKLVQWLCCTATAQNRQQRWQ